MGRGFPAPVDAGAGRPQQELGAPILVPVLDAGHQLGPSSFPPLPGHAAGGCTISSTGRPSQKFGVVGSPGQPLPRFHVSHLPGLTTCFRGYWL